METMTPELLEKIESLVRQGATIVGSPPQKSPSLTGYPECDLVVSSLVEKLWGGTEIPKDPTICKYRKGTIHWGGALSLSDAVNYAKDPSLDIPPEERDSDYAEGLFGHDGTRPGTPYPDYESTADVLIEMGVPENFSTTQKVRYSQLQLAGMDIYFVANRTDQTIIDECRFRTRHGQPQLWDPLTGKPSPLTQYQQTKGITSIPIEFEPFQSFFVVFTKEARASGKKEDTSDNFPSYSTLSELTGSWKVSFDPAWGGPGEIVFDRLEDWIGRPEEGIRYYSGIASYQKDFDYKIDKERNPSERIYLELGEVHDLAVIIMNNINLGEVWTAPWHMDITDAIIDGKNHLEIRVANRWPNRLIGDEFMPFDGISDGKFPEWLTGDKERSSGRYTFTTISCYTNEYPLLPSGLLGPVELKQTNNTE